MSSWWKPIREALRGLQGQTGLQGQGKLPFTPRPMPGQIPESAYMKQPDPLRNYAPTPDVVIAKPERTPTEQKLESFSRSISLMPREYLSPQDQLKAYREVQNSEIEREEIERMNRQYFKSLEESKKRHTQP